ncbi:hypothetical protein HNP32_002101 [Brevundimonas bullata]|uniref:Uncharacterized protein n=1 Tax=Brevundimonas bullata TaxID=13160 RepID=A0A7W7IQG4_9CAUL|nr:hypothetical protein [Brevundimonas bullata]MBB6383329.1 hypothetical protein [Brevundimonas bullata]
MSFMQTKLIPSGISLVTLCDRNMTAIDERNAVKFG